MATKSELEESVNEKLETDIDWSELNKDDLQTFDELVGSEEFTKMVIANYAGDTAGGLTKSAVTNWAPGKGISVFTDDDKDLMDLLL